MGIATGTQTVFGEERIISSAIMKVKPRLFFFFYPTPSFMSPSLSLSIAFAASAEASHE